MKMHIWKSELASKDETVAKKQKVIMLEVKLEWNINGAIEEIVDHGNIDTAAVQDNLDIQSEEIIEGEHININEQSGCDQRMKMS